MSLVPLHAFGARYDLPAPLYLFLLGAGAVVFISFLLVLQRPVARREPDGDDVPPVRAVPAWPGWVMLAVSVLLILAGLFGTQSTPDSLLPTAFWLVFWIAVPITIAIFGNYWPYISPLNLVARLVGSRSRRTYPTGWGFWPAAVLFFLFACGELVFNGVTTTPAGAALVMIAYGFFSTLMAAIFGANEWLRRGEVFSVLFATWGRLGFFRFGEPGHRGFFGGLTRPFEASVSRLTFVLLLLVSVSFDGLLATPSWKNAVGVLPESLRPGSTGYTVLLLIVFVAMLGLIWGLFAAFTAAVRAVGRLDASFLQVMAGLIPSLVPIAFGYLVAHNLDYLVINGQLIIHQISDPLGAGLNLFGTANYEPNRNLIPTAVVWYFQIALIIAVHIAAVVLAHGYLGRVARTERQGKQAEWPWIVAMVGYTMSSLWLLAQPIVQEGVKG
jgi:drug/metabolite transporter (DMT)-like permease